MANKVKKRVVSELDVVDESGNAKSTGQETKKVFKKAKVNDNSIQTVNKAKQPQLTKLSQGDNVNASKKSKKNKASNVNSVFAVPEPDSVNPDVKPKKEKVLDENAIMNKKLKSLKAKQLKREKKKQLRKEHGQYNVNNVTLTPEAMRLRISEIKSRENLTKTARRKLRILKKKLQIVEGTAPPPPPPPPPPPKTKAGEEVTSALSKKQKKKLKKEKLQLENVNEKQNDSADDSTDQKPVKKELVSEKNKIKKEFTTEFGNKKIKLEVNNKKLNLKNLETGKNLQKPGQNTKVPVKSEKEHESESIEDESEDESLEESVTPINLIKKEGISVKTEADDTSEDEDENEEEDEAESDEDEDLEKQGDEGDEENEESDDDEEEDNIFKNASPKKLADVKEQKEDKKDKNASISKIQNQQNGDKKKRYVLFVGNIPFKATVEDIKQHFLQKVSEVVSVRIPTAKGSRKPRGFAYVEVSNSVDYEKGLSLHQSSLQGFKINVEYTQTGSKNIKNKQEVVAKNKKLQAIRKAGKLAGSKKENHKRSFRRNFKKNQQAQKE